MDVLQEFEVVYSFKDIYKAQRKLTFSIDRVFLTAILGILFGVIEFLTIVSTSDSTRDLNVVLVISFLVAILTFFIGLPAISYFLALYLYKIIKSSSLESQIIKLTNDGVMILGKTAQNLFYWKAFDKIQRKNGLIELSKDKKMVLIFPSSGFKGKEEEESFFQICEAKIKAAMIPESEIEPPSENSPREVNL